MTTKLASQAIAAASGGLSSMGQMFLPWRLPDKKVVITRWL